MEQQTSKEVKNEQTYIRVKRWIDCIVSLYIIFGKPLFLLIILLVIVILALSFKIFPLASFWKILPPFDNCNYDNDKDSETDNCYGNTDYKHLGLFGFGFSCLRCCDCFLVFNCRERERIGSQWLLPASQTLQIIFFERTDSTIVPGGKDTLNSTL